MTATLGDLVSRARADFSPGTGLTLEPRHLEAVERLDARGHRTLIAALVTLDGADGKGGIPFGGALTSSGEYAVWSTSRLTDEARHVIAWILDHWERT